MNRSTTSLLRSRRGAAREGVGATAGLADALALLIVCAPLIGLCAYALAFQPHP